MRLQVSGSPSLKAYFFCRSNNPLHLNRAFSFLKALFIFSHYLPLSSEQLGSKREADSSPTALQKPHPEQVSLQVPEPLLHGPRVRGHLSAAGWGLSWLDDVPEMTCPYRDGLRAPLVLRCPGTPTPPDPPTKWPGA